MRNIPERLRDIQDAIVRIMKYTREGRYRYDHDELVQTWVTHNLYVIGEATRAIANEFPLLFFCIPQRRARINT